MRVRSEKDGRNGVRRFIELDEDDARFVLMELSASCPGDGFTRDLVEAVDEAWPAKRTDDEAEEDDEWAPGVRIVVVDTPVVDLMAILEASVQAAKRARDEARDVGGSSRSGIPFDEEGDGR